MPIVYKNVRFVLFTKTLIMNGQILVGCVLPTDHRTGGLCSGGVSVKGVSVQGKSLSRGVSVQEESLSRGSLPVNRMTDRQV